MSAATDVRTPTARAPAPAVRGAPYRVPAWLPTDLSNSWFWTYVVVTVAAVLRLVGLAQPDSMVFDEGYYTADAQSLLEHAVEFNDKNTGPGYVMHPPLGKWIIALGEWAFGDNSFGWRAASVMAGSISVLIMVRLARRMFGSTLLGCVAGLLLALDGMHFVLSRTGMLDIFQMTFMLAAFACLVVDRDVRRAQVAGAVAAGMPVPRGMPWRGWGPSVWWRLTAAVLTGCGLGVKLSGLYLLVLAFLPLMFCWELAALRLAAASSRLTAALRRELPWATIFVAVVLLTYLATWTGWLLTDTGWDRHWAEHHTGDINAVVSFLLPDAIISLWHYHVSVFDSHRHITSYHPWQSTPQGWLFLYQPTPFFIRSGAGCGASRCTALILSVGNPLLWWTFVPALVISSWRWLHRSDWRGGAIGLMVAAGLLPWMFFPDRTMFSYYALQLLPFLVLAVTLALGTVLGPATAGRRRRLTGVAIVGAYLILVALTFRYFYPIYTGTLLPADQLQDRMWLDSWLKPFERQ